MAVFTVGARLHDYGKGTPDELFGKVSSCLLYTSDAADEL